MDNRMDNICKQLQSTDLENEEILVDFNSVAKVMDRGKMCLLMKLLTSKYYNREPFEAAMRRVWHPVKPLRFHDTREGLMIAKFELNSERSR